MVLSNDGGTVGGLMSAAPMANKPYTVSEYNHSFPNRYQTETMLFITAYSSFHDIDGLMIFHYNDNDEWETDMVTDYFNIGRNTAMMALVPSCATAYRNGLISPAQQTILVNYAPVDYLLLPKRDNGDWQGPVVIPKKFSLQHAVRAQSYSSTVPFDISSFPLEPASPYITDTQEIEWDAAGTLTVATPHFSGAAGFLNLTSGRTIGQIAITSASDFGVLT